MEMQYLMLRAELDRFVKERGVEIVSSDDGFDEDELLTRHQLIDLPSQTPQFQDLAPEIRNLIYEELLCFKDGKFTCFPEILCTNKQINKEATGILYGKNDILVQLSNDGIFIHGSSEDNGYLESRFGTRQAKSREAHQWTIEDIEWPEYLPRVHSLKFSIIDSHKSNFADVRKVSNENVLYSLCRFLGNDHKLENFGIDLRRLDRQGNVVAKTSDLHCLLLLDPLPTLKIEGDGLFEKLTVDSTVDLRTIGRASFAQCREFRDACQS